MPACNSQPVSCIARQALLIVRRRRRRDEGTGIDSSLHLKAGKGNMILRSRNHSPNPPHSCCCRRRSQTDHNSLALSLFARRDNTKHKKVQCSGVRKGAFPQKKILIPLSSSFPSFRLNSAADCRVIFSSYGLKHFTSGERRKTRREDKRQPPASSHTLTSSFSLFNTNSPNDNIGMDRDYE